jgi:D-lactate dehydrogenase (cytochrome)
MIIKKNKDEFLSYLEDTSNLKGKADILYIPETQEEIPEILEICQKKNIPLTCSGARTGTTGGCVPNQGAILSLEKLNKIKDIDKKRRLAIVEAGLSLEDFEKEINKFGLTLRAQPTESLACLGGAVSTSASGVRGFRYGGIRKYVKRIKVALSDGNILNINRGQIISSHRYFEFELGKRKFRFNLPSYNMPKVKHQAGYFIKDNMDLIDLFIGSEGTLGVIIEIEIWLQNLPLEIFDCIVFFKEESDALGFVRKVKDAKFQESLKPTSLEFFDKNSLNFLKRAYSHLKNWGAAIYFEQEIEDKAEANLERWLQLIRESGASVDDTWFGDTEAERRKIYEFRHKLPQLINEYLKQHSQIKVATDIAVPQKNFISMYNFYKEVGEASELEYVNFGHIGEDHLHFNFLPQTIQEQTKAKEYALEFIKKAVSLGGTVSAEHGIGKLKKYYLEVMYGRDYLREMANLKKYFDPYCILGLDNIFDKNILVKNETPS